MHRWRRFTGALVGLLVSSTAMAHVGVHSAGGFTAGFVHPFAGLDHLLAMIAVGIWAGQLGGARLLALPAAFVSFMAIGAALGASGVSLPQVEGVVAFSVLASGIIVGLSVRLKWYWGVPLVAAFALFHGHAHGTEMPELAAPWAYFAGFLAATAALHGGGVFTGNSLKARPGLVRLGGAAIGLTGAWLVLSV